MLSKKHVEDICFFGQLPRAKQCRYINPDDSIPDKYYCLKLKAISKAKIDTKVQAHLAECKTKKVNPITANKPIGDNCAGYPLLKNILQGYDQP